MTPYALLLRGINVGGKNKVPMADLKALLETLGCEGVTTYIQSGNAVLRSALDALALGAAVENALRERFALDGPVRVLVLDQQAFGEVIGQAPPGFGEDEAFRDNVLFLMNYDAALAMAQLDPRQGVDQVWQGGRALYYRYSIAQASKSRISQLSLQPMYPSLTVRNASTTVKLWDLLRELTPEDPGI